MKQYPGFQGFNLQKDGDQYMASSSWATIPDWERYSCCPEARRSHLPNGIFQYVPKKGEGFPEDFIPFVNLNELVNAKY